MRTSLPIAEGQIVALQSSTRCERPKPCVSDAPASSQIDLISLFPQAAAQDRVRVEIVPIIRTGWYAEPHFWAFASITNNVTQHVTVITPQ